VSLVLDPSVVAGWYIGDESSPYTQAARATVAAAGALVPSLWPYEVTNLFLMAERRGRVTAADVSLALESLAAMPIHVRPAMATPATAGLARIAREYGLSAYDASYLDTAVRTGSSLATLDQALRRAADRAGVQLFSV
jgi:predicted nucleic acid-binding protein